MNLIRNIKGFFRGNYDTHGFWGLGIGNTGVNFIELKHLAGTFENIPEVAIVINKLASMCSNVRIGVQKANGEIVFEGHEALDVLNNPNPLQDKQELIREHFVYYSLYGNSYQYSNRVLGNPIPKTFWNLNPLNVEPIFTNKLYKQVDTKGIIKNYKVKDFFDSGKEKPFKTEDVMMKNEPSVTHPILGTSKLHALQKPISNIKGVYETRNILFTKGVQSVFLVQSKTKKEWATFQRKKRLKKYKKNIKKRTEH